MGNGATLDHAQWKMSRLESWFAKRPRTTKGRIGRWFSLAVSIAARRALTVVVVLPDPAGPRTIHAVFPLIRREEISFSNMGTLRIIPSDVFSSPRNST